LRPSMQKLGTRQLKGGDGGKGGGGGKNTPEEKKAERHGGKSREQYLTEQLRLRGSELRAQNRKRNGEREELSHKTIPTLQKKGEAVHLEKRGKKGRDRQRRGPRERT